MKEEFNLRRLEKAGIRVPRVVMLKKHVLVMEMIGENMRPAPKLRDARLNTADMQMAYDQCLQLMRDMYQNAGLVHADLSPYNLLWHRDDLYVIDVSQSVEKMHPKAHEFLFRDATNMSKFFKKAGVHGVMSEYELFNHVTGLNLQGDGVDFLSQEDDYEKNENRMRLGTGKDYAFEHYFELAQKEKGISSQEDKDSSLFERLATDSESDESDTEQEPQTDAQRLESVQTQSSVPRTEKLFDEISNSIRKAEQAWSDVPVSQHKQSNPHVHFQ